MIFKMLIKKYIYSPKQKYMTMFFFMRTEHIKHFAWYISDLYGRHLEDFGEYCPCNYIQQYISTFDHDICILLCYKRLHWLCAIWERERNVLFNDALNTFYLRLYGVRHMVKDHSDSEKGNPLPPHRLLLSISSKGYFICTIPQTG